MVPLLTKPIRNVFIDIIFHILLHVSFFLKLSLFLADSEATSTTTERLITQKSSSLIYLEVSSGTLKFQVTCIHTHESDSFRVCRQSLAGITSPKQALRFLMPLIVSVGTILDV